jgi:hypothetical protein
VSVREQDAPEPRRSSRAPLCNRDDVALLVRLAALSHARAPVIELTPAACAR